MRIQVSPAKNELQWTRRKSSEIIPYSLKKGATGQRWPLKLNLPEQMSEIETKIETKSSETNCKPLKETNSLIKHEAVQVTIWALGVIYLAKDTQCAGEKNNGKAKH